MIKWVSERKLALTSTEIRYLDGMKVTVEKVHDDVHDMGSSMQDLKMGQAEVQDRLNAMYIMLCGGEDGSSPICEESCLTASSL